jgi:hypothetical protein
MYLTTLVTIATVCVTRDQERTILDANFGTSRYTGMVQSGPDEDADVEHLAAEALRDLALVEDMAPPSPLSGGLSLIYSQR